MLRLLFTKRLLSSSVVLRNEAKQIKSSCLAGTPWSLNVKKTGKDPVALEDSEYPEWLWKVLDQTNTAAAAKAPVSEESLKARKKQIRQSNREKIKQRNFLNQL